MLSWLKMNQSSNTNAPDNCDSIAYKNSGDQFFDEDKLSEAVDAYQRAIAINPVFAEAYNNLGNAFREQGLHDEAENCLKQATMIKPDLANANFGLGTLLLENGRHEEAVTYLGKALTAMPDVDVIYRDLAYALFLTGKYDEAKHVIEQGILLNPNLADFHCFLGNIHVHENNFDLAIACYQLALSIQPNYMEVILNLGKVFLALNKLNEASIYSRKAMQNDPNLVDFHFSLGLAFQKQGKLTEAIACYREILAIKPEVIEVHVNLGSLLHEKNQLDDAIACYQQALNIKPDFVEANFNLGVLYQIQGKLPEAQSCFRQVLTYDSKHLLANISRLHISQHICEWESLEISTQEIRRSIMEMAPTNNGLVLPFSFLALPGSLAEEQKRCAENYAQGQCLSHLPPLSKPSFEFHRQTKQKIKIGYLSSDFYDHATTRLIVEVFELHNREQFHISAYSYGPDDSSAMRKRLINTFDQFVDIRDYSDNDSASKIYADQIDLLIDLKGFTQNSRSKILTLRPAPLQINYLGYPGTMGSDYVDYLIADHFIIPPESQKYYKEKIAYLPDCYQPNDRSRKRLAAPTRKSCKLPDSGFVFCCFNQTYKITPEIFDSWCRLLISVPNSVLWLFASTPYAEENLKRESKNRGVNPERLIMASLLPADQHLARLQCADLFLDTIPVNAHTTCSDALWMGLPVVTCVGETFPSRVAGSLLSAIGAPELITYNLEDYYQLALDLATNKNKLESIRNKIIANRDTAPLFDSERFTRNLEQAYIQMIDEYSHRPISSVRP